MTLVIWILCAACALECLVAWRLLQTVWRVPDLPPASRGADEPPLPSLATVVPARDEGHTVARGLRSRLEQDLDEHLIVVVDDDSQDDTAGVVDELVAELAQNGAPEAPRPRLRVVRHSGPPSRGWLGKVHAMQLGLDTALAAWKEANGADGAGEDAAERPASTMDPEWILFSDADVRLKPGTLRAVLRFAEEQRLDHLTLLPRLDSGGLALDMCVSAFLRSLVGIAPLWRIPDPSSRAFLGIGAFNLVRRSALERTEGLAWLRMDVGDDLALGLLFKRAGLRSMAVNGTGWVEVAWTTSLMDMARGMEKNLYAVGCRARWWLGVVFALVAWAFELAPFALVALGLGGWAPLPFALFGAVTLAAGAVSMVALARWGRSPALPALLTPVGGLIFGALILRAGILGGFRGGIRWRGRYHPTQELRAGARVKLP